MTGTRFELHPKPGTTFEGTLIAVNEDGASVNYDVATNPGQGVLVVASKDGFHVDVL